MKIVLLRVVVVVVVVVVVLVLLLLLIHETFFGIIHVAGQFQATCMFSNCLGIIVLWWWC